MDSLSNILKTQGELWDNNKFNMDDFNIWLQDNYDYSMLKTKEAYLERKSNDCIYYCINVLKMYKQKAWIIADNMYITESKRIGE